MTNPTKGFSSLGRAARPRSGNCGLRGQVVADGGVSQRAEPATCDVVHRRDVLQAYLSYTVSDGTGRLSRFVLVTGVRFLDAEHLGTPTPVAAWKAVAARR